jgi:hypothetical protein
MNADSIPASVRAMADDPQAPTAPLEDFIEAMRYDDNWWWRIGCGHHLNLFEEALDRVPPPATPGQPVGEYSGFAAEQFLDRTNEHGNVIDYGPQFGEEDG